MIGNYITVNDSIGVNICGYETGLDNINMLNTDIFDQNFVEPSSNSSLCNIENSWHKKKTLVGIMFV